MRRDAVRSGVVLTRTQTQPGCAGTEVRLRRVDSKWRAGAPSTTRGARVLPTPHARFQKIEAATFGENPDPSIQAPCPPSPAPRPHAKILISGYPLDTWSSVGIPTVGAKGPSPWSEAAVIRLN